MTPKSSGTGVFLMERFLTTKSGFKIDTGMFRLFIHPSVSFNSLRLSRHLHIFNKLPNLLASRCSYYFFIIILICIQSVAIFPLSFQTLMICVFFLFPDNSD